MKTEHKQLISPDGLLFLELSSLLPNPWTNAASRESSGDEFHGSSTRCVGKHILSVLNWNPRAAVTSSRFVLQEEGGLPRAGGPSRGAGRAPRLSWHRRRCWAAAAGAALLPARTCPPGPPGTGAPAFCEEGFQCCCRAHLICSHVPALISIARSPFAAEQKSTLDVSIHRVPTLAVQNTELSINSAVATHCLKYIYRH